MLQRSPLTVEVDGRGSGVFGLQDKRLDAREANIAHTDIRTFKSAYSPSPWHCALTAYSASSNKNPDNPAFLCKASHTLPLSTARS